MVIGSTGGLNNELDFHEGLLHEEIHDAPKEEVREKRGWHTVRKKVKQMSVIGTFKAALETRNRQRLITQVVVLILAGCLSVMPAEIIVKKDSRGTVIQIRLFKMPCRECYEMILRHSCCLYFFFCNVLLPSQAWK